jgi:hypothetical protein
MMLLPMLLLLQDTGVVAKAYADYREATRAEVRCERPKDESEITVCARREAYRYQTPLVRSDNRASNAHAQEDMLGTREAQGFVECGQGAFLVRCGSVGVGVSVGLGPGAGYVRRAPPP